MNNLMLKEHIKPEKHYLKASIISSLLILLPIVIIGGFLLLGNSETHDSGANQGFGIGIGAAILSLLTTSIIPFLSITVLSRLNIINLGYFILLNAIQLLIASLLLVFFVAPNLGYKINRISDWREDLGKLTAILFFFAEIYSILFQLIWYKAAIGFSTNNENEL